MTDLPTKDEIVDRMIVATDFGSMEDAIDTLTVPDLLALLRERGCEIADLQGTPESYIRYPREKPDAMS